MTELSNYPDGLTERALDALIAEVDAVLDASPAATSALLDGTAAARRRRRMARQTSAVVTRARSAVRSATGPDAGEAA